MDVVSSAAQFFSAPASGGATGAASGAVSGAASLFGNGGGLAFGAGLGQPGGKAAEVVATFENLLAALINGDGASVQNALKAAVADGAVTLDDGKLALGPALQKIAPAELASGKPALDQLLADGKAAPAAALLAMLLNGDGDVPAIQIEVAPTSATPTPVPAPEPDSTAQIAPVLSAQGEAAVCVTPVAAIEIVAEHGADLPISIATVKLPSTPQSTVTPSKAVREIATDVDAQAGVFLDEDAGPDAAISEEDATAAREQAAIDLMAALLGQQPAAPQPVVAKRDVDLTIESAPPPAAPAAPADFPAVPLVAAPTQANAAPAPAPEKASDFTPEVAPPQASELAPKHLLAAKVEPTAHAASPEHLAPAAARPVNEGVPVASSPTTTGNNATATAATATGTGTGGDSGANLNREGQQQSDSGQRQPTEIDMLRSGAVPTDSGRAAGHQDFASQLANASRGSHGSGAAPQMPAFQQVAVQIRRAVVDGDDHLSIQLKPAELGRIDVRLQFSGDGRVSAHITADNVATLDLMQRDTRGLERALQDAGLQTDSGSLSFNLRGDNRQAQDQQDNRGASGNARFTLDGPVEAELEELPAGRWVPAGRIDVRV